MNDTITVGNGTAVIVFGGRTSILATRTQNETRMNTEAFTDMCMNSSLFVDSIGEW